MRRRASGVLLTFYHAGGTTFALRARIIAHLNILHRYLSIPRPFSRAHDRHLALHATITLPLPLLLLDSLHLTLPQPVQLLARSNLCLNLDLNLSASLDMLRTGRQQSDTNKHQPSAISLSLSHHPPSTTLHPPPSTRHLRLTKPHPPPSTPPHRTTSTLEIHPPPGQSSCSMPLMQLRRERSDGCVEQGGIS